jgi:hypothetical protein
MTSLSWLAGEPGLTRGALSARAQSDGAGRVIARTADRADHRGASLLAPLAPDEKSAAVLVLGSVHP